MLKSKNTWEMNLNCNEYNIFSWWVMTIDCKIRDVLGATCQQPFERPLDAVLVLLYHTERHILDLLTGKNCRGELLQPHALNIIYLQWPSVYVVTRAPAFI
jgi:hypothetical protein